MFIVGGGSYILFDTPRPMSWIDEELERRRKEDDARVASLSEESSHRDIVVNGMPWAWQHLLNAVISDIEKFNSLSDRKAEARVSASEVEVHWLGKAASLLTIKPDPEKFSIVYIDPAEGPKKLKVVLNDYSDPYLWAEGEGQLTFEGASELLLKPVLFP
jgi:hypothetical protein